MLYKSLTLHSEVEDHTFTFADVLYSPGLKAAFLGFLATILLCRWQTRPQRASLPEGQTTIRWFEVAALFPPTVYGTVGLLVARGDLQLLVGYLTLGAYSFFVMAFLMSTSALTETAAMLANARSVGLGVLRRLAIFVCGRGGEIATVVVFGSYFTWIEDGIQRRVFSGVPSFAELSYGIQVSDLTRWNYVLLRWLFIFWLFICLGGIGAARCRFSFVKRGLRIVLSAGVVISLATAFAGDARSAERQCDVKALTMSSSRRMYLQNSECTDVTIDRVAVSSPDLVTLQLTGNMRSVTVRSLILETPLANFQVTGGASRLNSFIVERIEAAPSTGRLSPGIRFANFRCDRLLVGSQDQQSSGPITLRMEATCEFGTLLVKGQTLNDMAVYLGQHAPREVAVESSQVRRFVFDGALPPAIVNEPHHIGVSRAPTLLRLVAEPVTLDAREATDVVRVEITNALFSKAVVQLNSGTSNRIPLFVGLKNITLATDTSTFSVFTQQTNTEVAISNSVSPGKYLLNVDRLDNLTIDGVMGDSDTPPSLQVTAREFSGIRLNRSVFDDARLCNLEFDPGAKVEQAPHFRRAEVYSTLALALPMVRLAAFGLDSPVERTTFLKQVQEHGVSCYGHPPQSLAQEAVYQRRSADATRQHWLVAWVLDRATGHGVRLRIPLVTLLGLVVVYSILRTVLVVFLNRGRRARAGKEWAKALFVPLLLNSQSITAWRLRHPSVVVLRNVFRFLVSLQLTVWSLYLALPTL
jgi:hypothetical protein